MKNSDKGIATNVTVNCPARVRINAYCSCPKIDCPRHGLCCECILDHKHRENVKMATRFPHCLRDLVHEAVESGS